MEKITFTFEGEDQAVEFFVLEQTKLGGVTYILVQILKKMMQNV